MAVLWKGNYGNNAKDLLERRHWKEETCQEGLAVGLRLMWAQPEVMPLEIEKMGQVKGQGASEVKELGQKKGCGFSESLEWYCTIFSFSR